MGRDKPVRSFLFLVGGPVKGALYRAVEAEPEIRIVPQDRFKATLAKHGLRPRSLRSRKNRGKIPEVLGADLVVHATLRHETRPTGRRSHAPTHCHIAITEARTGVVVTTYSWRISELMVDASPFVATLRAVMSARGRAGADAAADPQPQGGGAVQVALLAPAGTADLAMAQLLAGLSRDSSIQLVEREQIDKVLAEQRLPLLLRSAPFTGLVRLR